MTSTPRDLYIPTECWMPMINICAPTPDGMDAGFAKALEQFERYSMTITGEIGNSIQRCHKHLNSFLDATQEAVTAESGENSARLGRPREMKYGQQQLIFQVFSYKGTDCVSLREDRMASIMTNYDLFRDTMRFMQNQVKEGDLGILRNSFLFIQKPLDQSAEIFDAAIEKLPITHTTAIGIPADPEYVHIVGTEPSEDIEPGCICRVLKQGYAFEGREIQEGVVFAAEKKN